MKKAFSFIVLSCESLTREAEGELKELVSNCTSHLKHWKVDKISTLETEG